ncbi:uncharacterized protein ACJ7VT_018129 isoform 2-T2 [Polymixia lowei]
MQPGEFLVQVCAPLGGQYGYHSSPGCQRSSDCVLKVRISSQSGFCRILWLPGWKDVVHEDVPGEVQEAGELATGRGPQTEDRAAYSIGPQSELGNPNTQSFEPMFQPPESPSQMPTHTSDYGYSAEPPTQIDKGDDFNPPVQSYVEEEEPRRKPILYEDLRIKNRENYEVTLTQKAETLLKTAPEREPERSVPTKDAKKNIYGDTWEE